MTAFTVRRARTSDLTQLRDVYRRSSLSNDGERDVLLAHPDYLVWCGDVGPESICLVAETDSTVIGFATLTESGELEDLFVVPECKRRGVASGLVEKLTSQAVDRGIDRIEVDANPHALSFYLAAGFVEIGRVATEFGEGIRMVRAMTPTS